MGRTYRGEGKKLKIKRRRKFRNQRQTKRSIQEPKEKGE